MVNSGFLDGMDVKEAISAMMDYLEKNMLGTRTVRYHLRDWIFSRQHYWGEPIPIVHCASCGDVPVPEDDLPVELPDVSSYEPTGTGESPLAAIDSWVQVACPSCGGPAKRETDTMPNWAGSSWYFLRYCDPNCRDGIADKKKLAYWMPVDFYDGGAEHTTLHLLYSRFWHKFLYDIGVVPGKEPYLCRRNHGMVYAPGGELMSKSKGNSVNPDDIVSTYGADITRLYLLFMGPYQGSVEWNTDAFSGVNRFVRKFWDFFMDNADSPSVSCTESTQREIYRLAKIIGNNIDDLKFNTSVAALMECYNKIYQEKLCRRCLQLIAVISAPLLPHVSEEFWKAVGGRGSVHARSWPEVDEHALKDETVEIVIQINGKVRGRVSLPADADETIAKETALAHDNVKKYLDGKHISTFLYVPGKIITLVVK